MAATIAGGMPGPGRPREDARRLVTLGCDGKDAPPDSPRLRPFLLTTVLLSSACRRSARTGCPCLGSGHLPFASASFFVGRCLRNTGRMHPCEQTWPVSQFSGSRLRAHAPGPHAQVAKHLLGLQSVVLYLAWAGGRMLLTHPSAHPPQIAAVQISVDITSNYWSWLRIGQLVPTFGTHTHTLAFVATSAAFKPCCPNCPGCDQIHGELERYLHAFHDVLPGLANLTKSMARQPNPARLRSIRGDRHGRSTPSSSSGLEERRSDDSPGRRLLNSAKCF